MIFWKSWNWPSYGRECLLYWLCWHLVIETSSLTIKKPKSALPYFPLWMWRHDGTLYWKCSTATTDNRNSHESGFKIQNTVITGHSTHHKMNWWLWSMFWKYWGHSDIGHCGCRRGIHSHCIMSSQCTMTCSIRWMASCELSPSRKLNGRKTYSLPWS